MIMKIIALRLKGYISIGVNVFDGVICIVSVVDLCNNLIKVLTSQYQFKGFRAVRIFKSLRVLKVIRILR